MAQAIKNKPESEEEKAHFFEKKYLKLQCKRQYKDISDTPLKKSEDDEV